MVRPKPCIGPPCAFAPLQRRIAAAPHRSVTRWPKPPDDPSRDAASPELPCPTTHSRAGGSASLAADPSATACRVRGLATPCATSTTDPPGVRNAGASLGFALQGLLLARERYPSRGLCPPDVAVRGSPERDPRNRPPPGPRSHGEFVLAPDPRRSPTVDAFLGFSPPERSPHPSGPPLVVAAPALASLGGMTSLPAWTSGLRRANGSAWSVSGLPALLGFRTLRPSRRAVHRPGSGLIASPPAGRRARHATPTAV